MSGIDSRAISIASPPFFIVDLISRELIIVYNAHLWRNRIAASSPLQQLTRAFYFFNTAGEPLSLPLVLADMRMLLDNTQAVAALLFALAGLMISLVGCMWLIVAYVKRSKVVWSRRKRRVARIGGALVPVALLVLPAVASWLIYLVEFGNVNYALVEAAPDVRAPMLARSIENAWSLAAAVCLTELVLLVPCAVLFGLALSVPRSIAISDSGTK